MAVVFPHASHAVPVRGTSPGRLPAALLLAAVGVAVFAVRLTGLPNLLDNEYRVGATVLDVLQHHNWLCPHDVLGNTDKPPMLTWLAALASWPGGRVTRLTLYLPTAAATVSTAWLILVGAGRRFGARAGFLGGLAYLLSHVAAEQMGTARFDGLFAFTVTLAALLAFHAWTTGRGWSAFWLAAAAATLTKGPLGVLLGSLGLLAIVWERRDGRSQTLGGSHAVGTSLFVLITVGWFLLAYRQVGPHLVHNMIGDEFIGNMTEHAVGYRFWKPIGDFVADFAPWSVLVFVALYRIVRAPAAEDEPRRFERFLFCWFVGGVLLFSASPHNQARLLDPMIPAAAMLAGRELDGLVGALPRRIVAWGLPVVIVVALGSFGLAYHWMKRGNPEVRRTTALLALADTVRTTVGEDFPLVYVDDSSFAMQLDLNTMHPPVSFEAAAELLRGDAAAFAVVGDVERLRRKVDGGSFFELASATEDGRSFQTVVGNRPRLAWEDTMATRVGPLVVTLQGLRLGAAWDATLAISRRHGGGLAVIENASGVPQRVRVLLGATKRQSRVLAPLQVWKIALAPSAHVDGPGPVVTRRIG